MTDNGGFTLNGTPISDFGAYLAYAPNQPLAPDTRDLTETIPGKRGQYWYGSEAGTRRFRLPCRFSGQDDSADLDVLARALAAFLVDIHGRPRLMRLVFDDSPDLTYSVRYEGEISFDRAWVGHSEFTLDLVADTPYAEEDEESETGSITTSPASITVLSSGTVDTPAIVTITNTGVADVDGFSLTIQYTEDLV
jgi:predicted phage tail component-like protein